MKPQFANFLRKIKITTVIVALTLSLGIFLLLGNGWLLNCIITSVMVLKPNSAIENTWRKMPMALPTDIYFFNWTNPEDFHNFSTKPKFEQVGPYRFMQNMEKVNVVWNDNDTVTYNQVRYWHFEKDNARGNLSDRITTINAITMSAAHYIKNWNYIIKRGTSIFLSSIAPNLHITRTVNQFLFEGYDDLIIDMANYLPFIASEVPRFDRFGWFRIVNGSETFEGVYNMANGVNGNFEILNWNYQDKSPFFNGSCAKVHGSGGELYTLKPTKDYIGMFLSHICRYLKFEFEDEVTVNGILGYKYSIGNGVLDNGTLIPGNECYCAGNCIPSGMINVSSCRYGSPTYVSLPHFHSADPVYVNAVEGLQPEKNKHEAYIVLEPNTGIPLQAGVRLQLNILVHPDEDITIYRDVPEMFFPLLWLEQKADLPDYALLFLKIYLNLPYIINGLALILISLGLYVLVSVRFKPGFLSLRRRSYQRQESAQLTEEKRPLQLNMINN